MASGVGRWVPVKGNRIGVDSVYHYFTLSLLFFEEDNIIEGVASAKEGITREIVDGNYIVVVIV